MPDSVNTTGADSLTASAACPNYSPAAAGGGNFSSAFRAMYQPGIAARLNTMLDGLTLNTTDVGVMQDLCGWSVHINGDRRFCNIFTREFIVAYFESNLIFRRAGMVGLRVCV